MNEIAVIDFGGQYTHLIANRVRNLGLYAVIYQPEESFESSHNGLVGVILSGGPHSVTESCHPTIPSGIIEKNLPILGICYGHQLLAQMFGGTVNKGRSGEFGLASIDCQANSTLFRNLPSNQKVWMSHGDHVTKLPDDFSITASSGDIKIAAFESGDKKLFGVQFHPEVTHSEHGMHILDRFLNVCTTRRDWTPESFKKICLDKIREEAADRRLLILLSGGVDSLVTLSLCVNALGKDRVSCIHVDTGFMRVNESAEVIDHLKKSGFDGVKLIDAGPVFFKALENVFEPEEKRRIIGELFVDIVHNSISGLKLPDDWLLVQGTIYPDRIESGATKHAARIKTHHNRVNGIRRLISQGRILEPLKDLYKDEVRKLGSELGLPEKLLNRQPFPGPGLAIRILCSDASSADSGSETDEIKLKEILHTLKLDGRILPVKSVGVQGDSRTYLNVAAIWNEKKAGPDFEMLCASARLIANSLKTVNRAVFSRKPLDKNLAPIRSCIDKSRAELLGKVDLTVRMMTDHCPNIWQFPVISLPLSYEGQGVFVLRPIVSRDAMTADVFRMDIGLFNELVSKLEAMEGVGAVLYDLTSKPPGTIEWE